MGKVPYDPLKDIVSIARVARTNRVLVTAATQPAKDFKALIADLKKRKGQTSFASFGTGTASHYAGLILSDEADLGAQHVGYQRRTARGHGSDRGPGRYTCSTAC